MPQRAVVDSNFIYKADGEGYYFVVCSRMEEATGHWHYLCQGPGIGQGGFSSTEEITVENGYALDAPCCAGTVTDCAANPSDLRGHVDTDGHTVLDGCAGGE